MPVLSGREVTTDTLLLARLARDVKSSVCFDLGTGTGEVLSNAGLRNVFSVGIDVSFQALALFDRSTGQPVLCSVETVPSMFRKGCADLVLANPPYNVADNGRKSPDPLRREARDGDSLLLYRFIFAGAHLLREGGCMIVTGRHERRAEIEFGFRAAGFYCIEKYDQGRVVAVKALLKNS